MQNAITAFSDESEIASELSTLVDLLRWRALNQTGQPAYGFLTDEGAEKATISYGKLDRQARAIAALLVSLQACRQQVLLLYPRAWIISAHFSDAFTPARSRCQLTPATQS